MQTLADTIVDNLAAAIARGLGWIARGLEAWRAELAAELAARPHRKICPPPVPKS